MGSNVQGRRFRFNVTKNLETDYLKKMIQRIHRAVLEPDAIFNVINDLGVLIDSPIARCKVVDFSIANLAELSTPEYQSCLSEVDSQCFVIADSKTNLLGKFGRKLVNDGPPGFFSSAKGCGNCHVISAEFSTEDGVKFRVEFKRQYQQKAFSENTMRFLNYLHPHFVQYFRLSNLFQNQQLKLEGDSTPLKHLSRPLWIVNKNLKLIFCNQHPHHLMEWNECFSCANGHLYTKDDTQNKLLQEKVRRISQQNSCSGSLDSEEIFQNCEVISLAVESHEENFWIMPMVANHGSGDLVMITGRKKLPKKDWLENNFNLTPRQSQLCLLLMQGCSLTVTAQHLQISVNTVRNLLAACFRVLEVNNQSELIRLLYSEILLNEV